MEKKLYQGRILHLYQEDVTLPNGNEVSLEIFRHPGASAVVVFREGLFYLIRQYRHATRGYLWEIPAGTRDGHEEPLVCAKRELLEEAGYVAKDLRYLGKIFTVPGFCTEEIHLFLADDVELSSSTPEDDEAIDEVRGFTPMQVMQMIASGEINDAKTMCGLFHAFRVLGLSLSIETGS